MLPSSKQFAVETMAIVWIDDLPKKMVIFHGFLSEGKTWFYFPRTRELGAP